MSKASEREKTEMAIKTIVKNCGKPARSLLLAAGPLAKAKAIEQLSRTSPERQMFELGELRQGHRMFTQKTTVFDTLYFGEINSRLARASGFMNKVRQMYMTLTPKEVLRLAPEMISSVIAVRDEVSTLAKILRSTFPLGACVEEGRKLGKSTPRVWTVDEINEKALKRGVGDIARGESFIVKNARDIPRIHGLPTDRQFCPTRNELHGALIRLARMHRDCIRVINHLRHRGKGNVIIATHTNPDADALVSTWLAERYLHASRNCEIRFVPYNCGYFQTDPADSVLDLGGLYSPGDGLFDHKEPAFPDRSANCTATLLWKHLKSQHINVDHLKSLIDIVHERDRKDHKGPHSPAFLQSDQTGLLALIRTERAKKQSDILTYAAVKKYLDSEYALK